ncbi:MAG: acyl-ACP--UDP-N-acetylglucosamine O-acyltransferase [Holophagales bacterium]|nr:acyl-ACP--UDP-N-acetylglucosamine O-acyltransferase [Holophagales bacterium]
MATEIHPTAVVDPSAELGVDVVVGPHATVGAGVELGDRCRLDASAVVQGPAVIGSDNHLYSFACLGFDPQDVKFGGEETRLEVGSHNAFREHSTVHRGTGTGGGVSSVGNHGLFMVGAHIAHDCRVGDHVIFANNGTLAGHVDVEDHAVIGAFTSVHQFCRGGAYAYIGGYSVITRDVLPYVKTVGAKPVCYGVNKIGLERKGFTAEEVTSVERAYRILVRSRQRLSAALEQLRTELAGEPRVDALIRFVESSERGVITDLPGRKRGSRGG